MRIYESFAKSELSGPFLGQENMIGWRKVLAAAMLLAAIPAVGFAQWSGSDDAFLPSPVVTASTVPSNGDVNPYGVAFIHNNFQTGAGPLMHGDILVSNFNNKSNTQGTGTTIVRVPSGGSPTLFYQAVPQLGTVGLSTALGTLQYGWVVVGNVPVLPNGTAAEPGSLLFINNQGKLVYDIKQTLIQAPWDMALVDQGDTAIAFITDGLTGTVARLTFKVGSSTVKITGATTIASGYVHRPDPVTFLVAPTGLVYDARRDRLYVASTGDNAIFAIPDAFARKTDAGMGTIVYQDDAHLHGALAMAEAPNGHLLVTNSDGINSDPTQPSEIVEFTKDGYFVKEIPVDPAQGGSFGLAVSSTQGTSILAAVDDNTNSLIIWTLNKP